MRIFIVEAYKRDGRYLGIAVTGYFTAIASAHAWIAANPDAGLWYAIAELPCLS